MQDLETIYTATYIQDIIVIRARIESENIECFVQDELTLQTNPFYSNAIGGVKLQVKINDVSRAKEILRDGGYVPEGEDLIKVDSVFNRLFEKLFKNGKFIIPWKKIGFVIAILAIVSFLVYWISRPSIEQMLIEKEWCLDHLSNNGKNLIPNTIAVVFWQNHKCNEVLDFYKNGFVTFPGFNSRKILGQWNISGNKLEIISTDTLQNVLQGNYTIEIGDNSLLLTSPKTIIYCY